MDVDATPKPILQFDQVTKTYDKGTPRPVTAIENVDFFVKPNEFVAVIGPSGCGKTTILRLAAGLEIPTNGKIFYYGKLIREPDRCRGLVFQSYNVFPWLTVRSNIAFGLDNRNPSDSDKLINKWLELTGLSEFADAYPKALSGGMRQRLALARTLIVEPELLLLDEPFGALDEPTRETMRTLLLKAVRETGCSVLLVTHGIREAILVADRIILMSSRPGRIHAVFKPVTTGTRNPEYQKSEEFHSLYNQILVLFPTQEELLKNQV